MDKKDFKYILKRVITFFIIFFLLLFFRSCEVKALEYPLEVQNATFYFATPTDTYTLSRKPNTFVVASSYGSFYRIVLPTSITSELNGDLLSTMLYEGQYLIEFYLYSNRGIRDNLYCYQISSNFENINITTGNWVSNEITSQCIDVYKTTYNNVPAYRILYKFTYNAGNYAPGIDTFRFSLNSSPYDFFAYTNLDVVGVSYSNIYDYDSNMVSQFNLEKNSQVTIENSQTMINQNNTMINQNTEINNSINDAKNQAHQDSQAIKDAMTDTSSPNNLNGLSQSAGWLPPGPVDSILNLPLSLLNNISDNLSKSCQPVVLNIPYVNSTLTLPCLNTLYEQMGVGTFLSFVGSVVSCFILLSYLLKLYKWVDDTLTFRENNYIDNWGGI